MISNQKFASRMEKNTPTYDNFKSYQQDYLLFQ